MQQPAPPCPTFAQAELFEGGPSAGAKTAAAVAAVPATSIAAALKRKDNRVIAYFLPLLLGLSGSDPVLNLVNEGGDNVSEESLKHALEVRDTLRNTVAVLGQAFTDVLKDPQASPTLKDYIVKLRRQLKSNDYHNELLFSAHNALIEVRKYFPLQSTARGGEVLPHDFRSTQSPMWPVARSMGDSGLPVLPMLRDRALNNGA